MNTQFFIGVIGLVSLELDWSGFQILVLSEFEVPDPRILPVTGSLARLAGEG